VKQDTRLAKTVYASVVVMELKAAMVEQDMANLEINH
jgi:hypothetical protein